MFQHRGLFINEVFLLLGKYLLLYDSTLHPQFNDEFQYPLKKNLIFSVVDHCFLFLRFHNKLCLSFSFTKFLSKPTTIFELVKFQILSDQESPLSRDLQSPHKAWKGRSKPSTDVLCSFLD